MHAEERIALVTGGSSGIGEACATALAAHGFTAYGTSRRTGFCSHSFKTLCMDVTDEESVKNGVLHLLQLHGRIDCLVNNAGFGLAGAVEDISIEEAKRQFETNFFGVLRVCQAVLPAMRQRGSGLIINISSLAGLFGLPYQGTYSASKFAMEGLSESLRMETRAFGVRIVLVEPGDVRTGITQNRVFSARSRNGSAYEEDFRKAIAVIEKEETQGVSPQKVAQLIVRIATRPSSRFRYTVGRPAQLVSPWIKRLGPWSIFERILFSFYGMAGKGQYGRENFHGSNETPSANR